MIQKLLLLNGAILTGCAFFIYDSQQWFIAALLLFLPLIDKGWATSQSTYFSNITKAKLRVWIVICLIMFSVLLLNNGYTLITLNIILFTALPEEWFFRAYFLTQLNKITKKNWLANIITSLLFAVVHVPAQGVMGLSVFIPSLIFGYTYMRYGSFITVVLLHALSNLVYLLYLKNLLN